MNWDSIERRVLIAVAGAPLRWQPETETWLRTDLPPPLRAAALSRDPDRVERAVDGLHLAGLLRAATSPGGRGASRRGLLAAGDIVRGLVTEQRRALRRLYRAGEAIRRERAAIPDSGLHPDELRGLPGGIVIEWVAPVRTGGASVDPVEVCCGYDIDRLEHKGLAIVLGSRALLTGGGEWAAELLWPDIAAEAPGGHANGSGGRGAPGLGADPETARETPQRPSNGVGS